MNISEITLFRAPELDSVLGETLCRALSKMPPGGVTQLPRPAALVLTPRCTAWVELTASDHELAALVLVQPGDALPNDPRIDDVVTPSATLAELKMRATRALTRKGAALALPVTPRADIDGVRWGEWFVALAASEARLVARLLAEPGAVISEPELAAAAFEDGVGTRRALHAHIYRLRMKLRLLPALEIQAVRQRGFRAVVRGDAPATR